MFHSLRKRARALKQNIVALWLACRDARTPWYAKWFAACVVAYAFSPIDLVPDFVPILGYVDDLILIPLGIWIALKLIPPTVMADSRKKAEALAMNRKPVNWAAGGLILLIWAAIVVWAIAALIRLL
jgi:uncharacterized membrane protein YkvA (DUF1232 family)